MSQPAINNLKRWMTKPYQLLFHAETHYRSSSDYDKRISFINFDNSIEVAISAFMHTSTTSNGSKRYSEEEIKKVRNSFVKKLEIFEGYILKKGLGTKWDTKIIKRYHKERNHLYHSAILSSTDAGELEEIRDIAYWIISVLFERPQIEKLINDQISESDKEYLYIPEDYPKPIIDGVVEQQHETPLLIASILGGWNENSQNDNSIIEEITSGF